MAKFIKVTGYKDDATWINAGWICSIIPVNDTTIPLPQDAIDKDARVKNTKCIIRYTHGIQQVNFFAVEDAESVMAMINQHH